MEWYAQYAYYLVQDEIQLTKFQATQLYLATCCWTCIWNHSCFLLCMWCFKTNKRHSLKQNKKSSQFWSTYLRGDILCMSIGSELKPASHALFFLENVFGDFCSICVIVTCQKGHTFVKRRTPNRKWCNIHVDQRTAKLISCFVKLIYLEAKCGIHSKNKRSNEMNHNCVGIRLKLKIVTNIVWQLWLPAVYWALWHFFPHRSIRIEVQPCIRPMIEVRHICRFGTFANIKIKLVVRVYETRWSVNVCYSLKWVLWIKIWFRCL